MRVLATTGMVVLLLAILAVVFGGPSKVEPALPQPAHQDVPSPPPRPGNVIACGPIVATPLQGWTPPLVDEVLVGRCLRADGQPMAGASMGYVLTRQSLLTRQGHEEDGSGTLDAEGRFQLDPWRARPPMAGPVELELQIIGRDRFGNTFQRTGLPVRRTRDPQGAVLAVGDITVPGHRTLAGVVLADGTPVPGARVHLDGHDVLTTDPLGRFELWQEEASTGAVTVHATSRTAGACEGQVTQYGTLDLTLALVSHPTVTVPILLPPELDPGRLQVRLESDDSRNTHILKYPNGQGGDLRFESPCLSAGTWSVEVLLNTRRGQESVHAERLMLRQGQHPRLDLIDLRRGMRFIPILVLDQSGRLMRSPHMKLLRSDGPTLSFPSIAWPGAGAAEAYGPTPAQRAALMAEHPAEERTGWVHGMAYTAFLTLGETLDVEITAPGHDATPLRGVRGPTTVTLAPTRTLLLEPGPVLSSVRGVSVLFSFTPVATNRSGAAGQTGRMGEDPRVWPPSVPLREGGTKVAVREDGEYEIRLRRPQSFPLGPGPSLARFTINGVQGDRLVIRGPGEHRFVIDISQEEWDAYRRRHGGR